jgi:hypothetical protein
MPKSTITAEDRWSVYSLLVDVGARASHRSVHPRAFGERPNSARRSGAAPARFTCL